MARAIASGAIPIFSMLSRIRPFISGLVMDSVKFVFTKPGEMIVTRNLFVEAERFIPIDTQ